MNNHEESQQEYLKEMRRVLGRIPQELRDTFSTAISQTEEEYNDFAEQVENGEMSLDDPKAQDFRKNYVKSNKTIYEDFLKAGGSEGQWNELASTVANGTYEIIFPKL